MSTPNPDLYPPAYHSYVLAILNGKWDEYDPIGQPESFQAVKWLSETYPDLKRKMQFDALSLTMDSHPSEVSSARAVVNSHRVGWKAAKVFLSLLWSAHLIISWANNRLLRMDRTKKMTWEICLIWDRDRDRFIITSLLLLPPILDMGIRCRRDTNRKSPLASSTTL